MSVTLNPYLGFRDTAAAAIEFYQSVFGGEVDCTTFAQANLGGPEDADKAMHARLVTPNGMTLMAADIPKSMELTRGSDYSVSLSGGTDDAEVLSGWFAALSEGGTIVMALEPAPWGDTFGMCVDRFGVKWMVNVGMA